MYATASSSLISITTTPNTSSNLHSVKTLKTLISIPKSPFKTPNFSLNFKPNHCSTLFRSTSPSYQTTQIQQTPEAELSEIEEELENNDIFEEEDEEESEPESPEAGKLYVGNLSYAITSVELAQIFREAGDVDAVEIVYDRVTNRSNGFAFITMASVQEAKEAITNFCGVV
ncbi:putative RNA recognition motif domain, nucleotide-binding alpha-beta plait domain superfamily [Helianthus debilis subsp. tardiflorus]